MMTDRIQPPRKGALADIKQFQIIENDQFSFLCAILQGGRFSARKRQAEVMNPVILPATRLFRENPKKHRPSG
jgi:hypothetical protein